MNKRWFWLLLLALAGPMPHAAAQDVWAYEMIGRDNVSRIYFRPPVDLTYPRPGEPNVVIDSSTPSSALGVRVTPQEVLRRLSEPKMRIVVLPAAQAQNIGFVPAN